MTLRNLNTEETHKEQRHHCSKTDKGNGVVVLDKVVNNNVMGDL